eukprot:1676478-Karenia_brevis.AAC.1
MAVFPGTPTTSSTKMCRRSLSTKWSFMAEYLAWLLVWRMPSMLYTEINSLLHSGRSQVSHPLHSLRLLPLGRDIFPF